QSWGLDWVWRKTGKGPWPEVVEVPGGGPTVVEGVSALVSTPRSWPDKGKRKAVSEFEAPKCVCRWLSLAPPTFEGGPSGSNVFSPGLGRLLSLITVCQGVPEILQAEVRQLQEEIEGLCKEVQLWEAQAEEIEQLRARLMWRAAGSSTGVPGFAAPSAQEVEELARGLHQAGKSESHRQEWLLQEVARTWLEVLGWAREHRLLLDGLSLGVSFVAEELAGHAVTPGLAQGVGHLLRLMEAHWHQTSIKVGSWLETFVDGLRTPPILKDTVEVAWELLDSEFGPGGGQEELQEGQGGGV
ncbi:hypothetical protein C0992_001332, partial [Termitomyces sp. T32_za158]